MKKFLFLAVVILFATINTYSLNKQAMNWGALTGCDLWATFQDGKCTSMTFNDGFTEYSAGCDNSDNTCYSINQNCDTGKWEIWWELMAVPTPSDKHYHGYWDPVTNEPKIEETNLINAYELNPNDE